LVDDHRFRWSPLLSEPTPERLAQAQLVLVAESSDRAAISPASQPVLKAA
jgi:hypothetical protein